MFDIFNLEIVVSVAGVEPAIVLRQPTYEAGTITTSVHTDIRVQGGIQTHGGQ